MPETETPQSGQHVDPERDRTANPFDESTGYSGQEHTPEREQALGQRHPSGHPLAGTGPVDPSATDPEGRDIPPDAGRRASFDPKTGAVHGSGAGAGGGNDGEDYDAGTPGA